MGILRIKASNVFAGPGSYAQIAEAEVEAGDDVVYVTVQEYAGTECTVSKESVYKFLAEEGDGPVCEFLEEYTSLKDAKGSAYADVFDKLKKVIKMLG